jgi:NAD+ synthase
MSSQRIRDRLIIAMAQLNSVMGDVAGNAARVRAARAQAAAMSADLVMLPELFLAGYPPEDLVLRPAFVEACREALEDLARETADGGPGVLVGAPWAQDGGVHNAYALLDGGRIEALRFKVELPNYGVFDEKRVFRPGPAPGPFVFRGLRIGAPICEDIWARDVVECLAETGAEILLVPNGSPYWRGKADERFNVAVARVRESGLPMAYLNQVGGQDELVFDGASFVLNADCALAAHLPAFAESVVATAWERRAGGWACVEGPRASPPEGDEADYAACLLGLRDYVEKNGFPGVVLGLSGGIDSALCAALAVDALGPERVRCAMLPYRFTSLASLKDARACAAMLGASYEVLPVAAAVEGLETALTPAFGARPRDVTEENLQSRARGAILMAISNKFGLMLATTGNKSEMSVGYATIYGDMNGGFNPIKDLYKSEVFRLAALRNRWKPEGALGPDGEVIPASILARPPSAELRENQTDQDFLPPYDVLDDILECLVEKDMRVIDVAARGHAIETVRQVERLLALAEYKRRQAPPGVKVTRRSFGRDRRYPIVSRFRDAGAPARPPDESLLPRRPSGGAERFEE